MIDFCFFYLAKVAVVFILILSSATLEAQQNDKFFDLMTAIGEHFGGEFNEAEKTLELDLNGANSFLERLHTFATLEIVTKVENGEFECKKSEKPDFKMVIKTILDEDMLNMLKLLSVKSSGNEKYALSTVLSEKFIPNKKVLNLLNALFVPKKSDQIPSGSDQIPSGSDQIPSAGSVDSEKFYSDEKLFNLLFSFAARLEALVHGKNSDGTLKARQENPQDKIQTFLAVPKCFPKWELSIFDYWIEIIKMKTKESKNPIFGVAIYKEKYDIYKNEDSKETAFRLSRRNYQVLKKLNDQKLSIYETTNLLRAAFNWGYAPIRIPSGKILQIFLNLLNQINSVFFFNWKRNDNYDKNKKCEYAIIFQNISESLMKMISDKGIDLELHLDSQDKEIRKNVQKDVEESCKKFDNEEAKIIFLNNIHYELAINFEYNQRKDIYDRAEDLLSDWVGHWGLITYEIEQISEESYLNKNAEFMLRKIKDFTSNTNRETISIIDALIGKEHIDQFNLGALFDQIKPLVEVTIPKEEDNLRKAKKEINTKQLEKDIKFLKNNPKSIAEEKYQKADLSIPLMQLTEQARTLAKTFGKMLENVKEHYSKSIK